MGVMDADVYGPSLPLLTGVTGRPRTQEKRIFPHEGYGLKLMSNGFLVTDDSLLSCLGQAMNEIAVSEFQYAIQETHGSRSQLIERVSVVETFEGDTGQNLGSLSPSCDSRTLGRSQSRGEPGA